MALELIKLVKGSSAVSQVGSLGFFKLGVDTGGGSGDLIFSRVFSENTPEQISAVSAVISANNMTSAQVAETFGWNLGDKISYQLTTGEDVEMRIIGFNHDDKSDGSGKAGITLDMTHCFTTYYKMNDTDTNAGGWNDTLMRTQTLPTIKATLPTEWQSVIKFVDKKASQGSNTTVETVSDDLFLLSEIEIYGSVTNAVDGANEGSQYVYWVEHNTEQDRLKPHGYNGTYLQTRWWLRSCFYKWNTQFGNIHNGVVGSIQANTSPMWLSFAFCV